MDALIIITDESQIKFILFKSNNLSVLKKKTDEQTFISWRCMCPGPTQASSVDPCGTPQVM